jgi:two-component system, chemotaxis family, CheB/CheR fusion protein
MQVFEVEDGMVVRPNSAYIIPPGRDMAFLGGGLQLLEPASPRGQRLPIDFFFRSLARETLATIADLKAGQPEKYGSAG